MWEGQERREDFRADLSERFREHGLELSHAELGRWPDMTPFWKMTVRHPARGVLVFSATLGAEADPYSRETLAELVWRVVQKLSAEA